jgi:hypothetical protein
MSRWRDTAPPGLVFKPGNFYPSLPPTTDSEFGAIAWTGSEWGIAWQINYTDRDYFFSRVSEDGQPLAPDVELSKQLAYEITPDYNDRLIWTGLDFVVLRDETLDRVACNCVDADADGFSSCVECDDGNASVNQDAVEVCDNGIDDDCDGAIDDGDPQGCETPLLAVIESFTADITPQGVVLRWRTSLEIDSAGFRLSRAKLAMNGQRATIQEVALHDGFIPPSGNAMAGADYSFSDNASLPPGAYRYYLEDIDSRGRVTRHGPIDIEIPGRRESSRRQAER